MRLRVLLSTLVAIASVALPRCVEATVTPTDADRASGGARERERIRRVAVTLNPLALLVSRWGANVEVLPARHHALVVAGYLQSFALGRVRGVLPERVRGYVHDDAPSVAGGELGYRFYSGRTGADGLFVGPSAVAVPLAYPRYAPEEGGVELQPYRAFGGALDLGVQKVTSSGLTVGGGVGVMVLTSRLPPDPDRIPLPVSASVLPRLLFTAGWSF